MKKILFALLFIAFSQTAFAEMLYFKDYFKDKSGCFIVYDLNEHHILMEYNKQRCNERISPDSTFKIPLSLMAFDQKLITQSTLFKWDGKDRGWSAWNQDQTPATWLKNSAVWVSQSLTPQLGLSKIQSYLNAFHYGNKDFSGGITEAWLSNSLTISATEQLQLLKAFAELKLPVSRDAMIYTKENMFLETSPQGWKLYGKTGTGSDVHHPVNHGKNLEDAWFIGFVEKDQSRYIFILNFTDTKAPVTAEAGGTRAKNLTKEILEKMDLF